MRKTVLLACCLLMAVLQLCAQTKTVTGTVTDREGKPLEGVSVTVKGTNKGVATGSDGTFSISTSPGDVLLFSSIGFKDMTSTTSRSSITIALDRSVNMMEEVVVTAGGLKTMRKEIGTSTAVVDAKTLTTGKATNIASGLQGKVAGLQISGTSGGVNPNYRLILRGQRSLTGNNQALLVLDNVVVPNSVLGNLNPEDVESVTVLQGASAAALYGSQASNGAVIVTTKKGKIGATSIQVSNTTMLEQVAFYPKFQKEFGAGGTAYGIDPITGLPDYNYLENQSYGARFDGIKRPLGPPLEDGTQDSAYYSYNDGHLKFWETGITNQTNIALTNGDANSTFYLAGQYANVTGTTPGDKYNRAVLRLNGTRKLGKMINVTYASAYTQNRYDITTQTASMYNNMLNMPSNVDITKYKNWRSDPFANPNGFYNPWYQNPYFTADNNRSKQRNDYLTGNVELKFTPINGLDFIARQGIATRNYSNKNTVGAFDFTTYAEHTDQSSKSDIAASVSDGSSYTTNLLTDAIVQYQTNISDFSVNLIAGGQWIQNQSKFVNVGANGLVIPDLFNVSNGVGTPTATESNYKARQMGVYGKAVIGYRDFIYITGTARNDWDSRLSEANRSFFYPSVSASFVATNAIPELKEGGWVNELKLRGGWSKVGQVNLGNSSDFGAYYLQSTFGTGYGFPYNSLAGYTVGNNLVASNLRPEITRQWEVGFDLSMLHNRGDLHVTWYSGTTDDQTVNTSISRATGFTNLRTNTGQTYSKGLELALNYTVLQNRDWRASIGGNYTYLDNGVNSISADLPKLALLTYSSGVGSYAIAGQAFPTLQGFDYVRDNAGHVIVDGITGLPTKTATVINLGSLVPKHRVGLNGQVSYKWLSLSVLFEYRGDYVIYNSMGPDIDWSGTSWRTAIYDRQSFIYPNSVIEDAGHPGTYVPNTSVSIANGNGNNGFWTDGINRDVTSNYVTSGDFWKLREAALTYTLPASLLRKTKFIKGVQIGLQGRNLFLWMAKDNYYTDPEYNTGGNDTNGIGLTGLDSAPPSRYFGGTLSLKF